MSIAKLSIRRPVFIVSLVVAILIAGFTCLRRLGVDLFPNIVYPVVSIQTIYPGASPADTETLVSKPIEEELGSLAGLDKLYSYNLESVSIVAAKFKLGVDIKNAEQQVRNRLNNVRARLPQEIREPVVRQVDPADQPILRIGVTSPLPPDQLYNAAHDVIRAGLERVEGVGLVEIVGGRRREIKVLVDRDKLQQREIPLLQIAQRMQTISKNVPVGKIEGETKETTFRTLGEFTDIDAIRRVVINFLGSDRPVRLEDVARVVDGLEDEKTRSLINGQPALFLDVFKQSGSNTVRVSEQVVHELAAINGALKEKNIQANLVLVRDGAERIKANLTDVNESILIGIVLCVAVVFLFLGSLRSTIITGLALPNSLLGAFILMYLMGFTVNIMTLLALSLAVGLLIDDAIVVRENIFRHIEAGENPRVAAERGTNEVALAVIATSLVVIAVFVPVAFLDGIVGQFLKEFGLTIVFALAISLFDALTVAPMLSAYWAGGVGEHGSGGNRFVDRVLQRFDRFQCWLELVYDRMLRYTLKRPKRILMGGLGIFVASLALVPFIPKTFLPPADNSEFEVRMELPPGTNLDRMAIEASRASDLLRKDPAVALTATTVGTREGESNKATVYVRLKPPGSRKHTTTVVKERFRASLLRDLGNPQGLSLRVQDYDLFGGGDRPFNLNISGENLDELTAYVSKLTARMRTIRGLADLDTNYRPGKPEFQIVFDRDKAESLGVSTGQAGAELRARVEGTVPASLRSSGQEYDIRVQLDQQYRDLRNEFDTTVVPNVNYNMIPLSKIAQGREASSFSQINRLNKARYVEISADIGSNGALSGIMAATQKIIEEELSPPPGIKWGFVGQAEEMQDLFGNMRLAATLGVVFVYLVLASLYESFITPFTILLALPLAVCGAIVALWITQAGINIFSLIGMIMLLGVVTKNSILLVDYTLKLEEEGLTRAMALREACRTRLRPILMTSVALIAGAIPIAIGLNEASSQRVAMGIALIGGLVSSTLLTLLVVPAAYGYVDDFRMWSTRWLRRRASQPQAPMAPASSDDRRGGHPRSEEPAPPPAMDA